MKSAKYKSFQIGRQKSLIRGPGLFFMFFCNFRRFWNFAKIWRFLQQNVKDLLRKSQGFWAFSKSLKNQEKTEKSPGPRISFFCLPIWKRLYFSDFRDFNFQISDFLMDFSLLPGTLTVAGLKNESVTLSEWCRGFV